MDWRTSSASAMAPLKQLGGGFIAVPDSGPLRITPSAARTEGGGRLAQRRGEFEFTYKWGISGTIHLRECHRHSLQRAGHPGCSGGQAHRTRLRRQRQTTGCSTGARTSSCTTISPASREIDASASRAKQSGKHRNRSTVRKPRDLQSSGLAIVDSGSREGRGKHQGAGESVTRGLSYPRWSPWQLSSRRLRAPKAPRRPSQR